LAYLRNNTCQLPDRAVAARNIRPPLAGQQQVPAAEHVKRQIAEFVVVAMEEPTFLLAVERNVGVVEIQHDLARRTLTRVEKEVDE
jgi:hypothetical protein